MKKMLILVGPSGSGKSTLIERLYLEFSDRLVDIITYTARPMRSGESEGQPYHFVSPDQFKELIEQDFFVEWAFVHGRYYGTPKDQVEKAWQNGKAVIMDIDIQGARSVKEKYPEAVTVFVLPPSLEALEKRILGRDGHKPKDFDLRMENAKKEMDQADFCDHQVLNEDIQKAYVEVRDILAKVLD